MAVLLEPLGELAFDVVVALDAVFPSGASGGMLSMLVERSVALCVVGGVVACGVAVVMGQAQAGFEGGCEV